MDLSQRKVWQQACGEPPLSYAHLCLSHGIILNGYDEESAARVDDNGFFPATETFSRLQQGCRQWISGIGETDARKADLTRFCHEMKEGDVVVLRFGTSEVQGVGIIEGLHGWNDHFGDVDGWHIPLFRRVRWFWTPEAGPRRFAPYDLKMGATTQALGREGPVWDWLLQLPEPAPTQVPLPPLAPAYSQGHISLGAISDYLFNKGVASASIRRLLEEIGELERIAKWYVTHEDEPSEHETVAYLVVPLLKALGWTPQKMAVEWNRIDVALFSSVPRTTAVLSVVVEVKKLRSPCLIAESQAMGYVRDAPACRMFILTDGLRYGVYLRQANGQFTLAAYLNLLRMRDAYPALGCGGAQEALRLISA